MSKEEKKEDNKEENKEKIEKIKISIRNYKDLTREELEFIHNLPDDEKFSIIIEINNIIAILRDIIIDR